MRSSVPFSRRLFWCVLGAAGPSDHDFPRGQRLVCRPGDRALPAVAPCESIGRTFARGRGSSDHIHVKVIEHWERWQTLLHLSRIRNTAILRMQLRLDR